MKRVLSAGVALCLSVVSVMIEPKTGFGQENPSTRYLPEAAVAVVSVWPKAMSEKERMQLAPLEVISASGLEQVGFDPLEFERVDVMIGMPMPQPTFGVLIQSSAVIDLSNFNPDMVATADDGNGLMRLTGPEMIVVKKIGDKSAVLGTEMFVDMMLKERGTPTKLHSTLAAIRGPQDLTAIVNMEALRQVFMPLLENLPAGAMPPPLVEGLEGLMSETEVLALRAEISEQEKLQLVLASEDDAASERLARHIVSMLAFGREMMLSEVSREMGTDSRTEQAMQKYLVRISQKIVETLEPRRVQNRLVMEVDQFQSISVIGTLTGLLLPAVQSARGAARRMQSSNNMKQLGLAMHNFESAYRSFPTTASADDDGEPLLSWRVAILPFIEQSQLYEKFNLDEPWDSEHNLALLEEMPDVYRHPGKATEAGHTVYQAPVGEQTFLRKDKAIGFGAITDGTSNTIMLIETAPEHAVPWTAPQDWDVDHEDPDISKIFFNGITNITLGDGSVQTLSDVIDIEVLKALLTANGGEVVNF